MANSAAPEPYSSQDCSRSVVWHSSPRTRALQRGILDSAATAELEACLGESWQCQQHFIILLFSIHGTPSHNSHHLVSWVGHITIIELRGRERERESSLNLKGTRFCCEKASTRKARRSLRRGKGGLIVISVDRNPRNSFGSYQRDDGCTMALRSASQPAYGLLASQFQGCSK